MKRKVIEHCYLCASPYIYEYRNQAGDEVSFYRKIESVVCSDCYHFLNSHDYFSKEYFSKELDKFFSENKRILFAYSGGLDSTAVLFKLANECQLRGIALELFSVNTGFKGKKTIDNINKVINYLELNKNFFWVDWVNAIHDNQAVINLLGKEETTFKVYKHCWQNNILPCGKICNSMMASAYQSVMKAKDYQILFTGGDTPKINHDGRYSIFWQDGQIPTVRGGYAFGLSKKENENVISNNNIPWVNPKCGGYDTDCLLPGAFFAKQLQGERAINIEDLYRKYPIIFHYLTERTRFKVIAWKDAVLMMKNVDISSLSSYIELIDIVS